MKHSSADTRKPYSGLSRSLVIAIDVGTTFSGVSYAILEPGEIPKIHGVTRFPGQEHVAGNSKIPSVIYYDKSGKLMAAGAEAESNSILAQAEDEQWIKAELFKLRLRPRTMQLNMNGMRLGPLPKRKTAVNVFGDFLAYLYRCTRIFITDTHANGAALWNAVENDIQFVLSHPNGWEGAQQTKMRRAAVYGALIPDTNEGKARIRFVTEGEASLHACVLNGLAADVLSNPSKHGFLIADAGGGTLDISGYAIRGTSPLVMEEVAPPDCIFAGSVFVSRRAREFLEEKLKNSKYGTPDAVEHITRKFDETTKRLFRDRKELQFIPFGSPLDKDPSVGIRGGQLKLTGNEVANLFEPSVDAAVNAIKAQIDASNGTIKSVFLVGGYAASPWLFNQLQERLSPFHVTVSRPDTQTSKAVADGAIGFYCDHHVSARMSKFMYGVEFLRELDPQDPEHTARRERLCELPSGPKLLPDAFDCILSRSVKVKESTVFTRKYCTELTNLSMLSVFEVEIWCYRGGNVVPKWIERQADEFSTLCVVRADLSLLSGSAEPKKSRGGKTYWTIVFSVEIHFGLTEFKARIKWMDNGTTKYGPAAIVYNERGHRAEEDEPDTYPEDDLNTPKSDRLRSEPASRARTPTDSFYSDRDSIRRGRETPIASAVPEVARVERSLSKSGPSISSPSVHSRGAHSSIKGSDGERTTSDSERKKALDKGKERERDRDREIDRDRTPVSRASSRPNSIAVPKPDGLYANGYGSSRPITPATATAPTASMSRTSSYRSRDRAPEVPPIEQPPPATWEAPPKSAVGDKPRSPWQEPQSAVAERPKTPWDAPAPSAPAADSTSIFGAAAPPEELPPPGSLSLTPSGDGHKSIFGTPRSAFGEGPKSIFGTPKSAFGDNSRSIFGDNANAPKSIFDTEPMPSAFGDTTTVAPALFEEPPVVPADQPSSSLWDDPSGGIASNGTTGGEPDMWHSSPAVVESPVVESPTVKGKKKKGSAAASRTSPAVSTKSPYAQVSDKSPFAQAYEPFAADPYAPAADDIAAALTSSSLAAAIIGSKTNSPKHLSPLNPASQEMPETSAQNFDDWGSGGWPAEHTTSTPPVETPITPADDTFGGTGKKKKGKKGSGATTPAAKSAALEAEEERRRKEQEEADAAEAYWKQQEADAAEKARKEYEAAEAARIEQERADAEAEAARIEWERADAAEAARIEQERADAAAEAARKKKEKEEEAARKKQEKADEAARKKQEKEDELARKKKEKEDEAARKKEKEDEAARKKKEKAEAARIEKELAEAARIEKELAEAARIEKELADAAEAAKIEKELADAAEGARIEKEMAEAEAARIEQEKADAARIAKEAEDAARKEKKEQEERDKAAEAAKKKEEEDARAAELFSFDTGADPAPASVFGGGGGGGLFSSSLSTPAWGTTPGDSDLGWGSTATTKKGKKSKTTTPAATTPTATTPSKFSSFGFGGFGGSSAVFPDSSANEPDTKVDSVFGNGNFNSGSFGTANEPDSRVDSLFDDFNSGSFGNEFNASLGAVVEGNEENGEKQPPAWSGTPTPIPPPVALEESPVAVENPDAAAEADPNAEVTSPTGEDGGLEGEGTLGPEAQEEDDGWGGLQVTNKKKKKKGKGGQDAAAPAAGANEDKEAEAPKDSEPSGGGGKKKKKGKK